MKSPPDISVISPSLVGRAWQLGLLARALAQAAGGRGTIVLIAGEAGIGKSRLVGALKALAAEQGAVVLQGRCFELDRGLLYAPLVDLLRGFLAGHASSDIAAALGPSAAELATLLPELHNEQGDSSSHAGLTPEAAQRQTFRALAQFFAYQAARQPVVAVVEDLHWSDDASLETLLFLARQFEQLPLLLVLTYRIDEVRPELAQLLVALNRERRAHEIELGPLSYAEIDTMLRAIFGQQRPIRSDFLSALYALTEGNPFFIEEVLKSLIAAGDIFYSRGQWDRKPIGELNIPRTIQLAVRQRAEQLGPPARRVLTLAAIIGRRFDFQLLQRLTGFDERGLLEQIKVLIAAQLVAEESTDEFTFRHALTREALYADLLARERKALHGQVALTLETLAHERSSAAHDGWAAELAYHFDAAGMWAQSLIYARQAAERAARLYAPRAAAEHYTRAIRAACECAPIERGPLYLARGQMYELLGDFEHARDDFETVLDITQASGDRAAEWQALLAIGFLWASRDYAVMGEYLKRALALARMLGDPIMLGHSLNRVGNWHLLVEQPAEALRYHLEALALFQAANHKPGLATTYDLLGVTNTMGDDIPAGVEYYQHAVALFRELGDLQGLASSLVVLSMRGASYPWSATTWPIADPAMCVRDGEEALRIARQIDWRAGEANALVYLAFGHGPRGEYRLAIERANAGLAIAREIDHKVWLVGAWVALGAINLDLLAPDLARGYFEQAQQLAPELGGFYTQIVEGLLISTCVAQHDFARARELVDATLDPAEAMTTRGQRLIWSARAELALASGDPAHALRILEQLLDTATQIGGEGIGRVPRLARLQAAALSALGRSGEAERALLAANAGAARRGLHPLRWRIQADLGRLYQSQDQRKQAEAAFAAARAIVDQLAGDLPGEDLRAAFLHASGKHLPRPAQPTPRQAARDAFGGLTAREREVAALVALGQSNREIATALVLSERTVATHISNILGKLNIATRAQIAAWASEKGLTHSAGE